MTSRDTITAIRIDLTSGVIIPTTQRAYLNDDGTVVTFDSNDTPTS